MNPKQIVEQIRKELKNKASTKTKKEREKARAVFGNEAKLLALKVPKTRKIAESFAKKLSKKKDFDTALKVKTTAVIVFKTANLPSRISLWSK